MSSLYWLIAALLLGAVEAVFPAGIFLFFGIGALAGSLLALVVETITWQVLCFAVISLLSLVLLRQRWRRLFSGMLSGPPTVMSITRPSRLMYTLTSRLHMAVNAAMRSIISGGAKQSPSA